MKTRIERLDPSGMGKAIRDCPQQITNILETHTGWTPRKYVDAPKQILYLGMGGSAIGGDLVRVWAERFSTVPMVVVRGYTVPRWIGAETLVLASSYSGNTEETLSAVEEAAAQDGRIVAIASGGQLAEHCQAKGWDFVPIPGGLQPRAAIGYSLAAVALILVRFRVLPQSVLDELAAGARLMTSEGERWNDPDQSENEPLEAAKLIGKRLPIIYGAVSTTEALALRLRGQLAENSKLLASHHVLPEQNHNEIVGLAERIKNPGDALVIWLKDSDDHPRIKLRQDLSAQLMGIKMQPQTLPPMECTLAGSGKSLIQRNLTLLHKIDWLSYYEALLRDRDPSDIEILTKLKQEMRPD
ncbi:MAG: bifunctional phosphoglucose/phosphomannose isomerase [Fidelibacterota bacterium]|nr:MAG: bifunctional phosphoglucose/phosphomannose isomerase [Candidatus Neomarinimicrobiota bacterium]